MRILVSIDDTDDADSKGTGEIAEIIADALVSADLATVGRVTRHQLLIHPDIAYTSHNSSMCFEADIAEETLADVIALSAETLAAESVAAADPGLAVVVPERLDDPERLMSYGLKAKGHVLTKDDAYSLAEELGVHLSEHGGTGIGVIGALAGAGLKMTGNDGRFKGKFRLKSDADGAATVEQIKHQDVDEVRTLDGYTLGDDQRVAVGDHCKLILRDGMAILMVQPIVEGGVAWTVVDRKALPVLLGAAMTTAPDSHSNPTFSGSVDDAKSLAAAAAIARACAAYVRDDDDECYVDGDGPSCFNCRGRRWVQGGFSCSRGLLQRD